jgi:hypothetical protein
VAFHPSPEKSEGRNTRPTILEPKTRSSHKAAIHGAQLFKVHGDSSEMMNGSPAAFEAISNFGISSLSLPGK